jgi:hypothetical protein
VVQHQQQNVVGIVDTLPDAPKKRNLTALGTLARRDDAADFGGLAAEDGEVGVVVIHIRLSSIKDCLLSNEKAIDEADDVERNLP